MIHCFRSLCYLCFINNIFWSSSVLTSCLVKARILLFYMLSYIIVSHESTLLCLFMTKVLCLAVITSLLIITSTKRFLELPIFISCWSRDSHDLSGWLSETQINSILSNVCSVMDHRWSQNVVRTKQVTHEAQPSMLVMFSPHFDVVCDLLLCRSTATWNPFVLYDKKAKYC